VAASERDEDARQLWRDDVQQLDLKRVVVIDESGTHRAMTPLYGRARRHERAVGRAPRNRGRSTTLLAALTLDGMGPAMLVEGGTDTATWWCWTTSGHTRADGRVP
jgi:hypothetical protein